jgi:hypothetical protein
MVKRDRESRPETISWASRSWGMMNVNTTGTTTTSGTVSVRLVHRPGGVSPAGGPFVGWGPKLGSI